MHHAERSHRLLEDHGDLTAADGAHLWAARVQGGQVNDLAHLEYALFTLYLAVKEDLPFHDAPRPPHNLQDGKRSHAFATPAFPHQPQRGASLDGEINAIDGFDHALVQRKMSFQTLDF